ncbi:pyridoxal phosphate-dependent aminotransferase [Changpingibacter yushuensis]|uniref:pyridoxal phosphate-dependent aminotransferase n=1 Tax=Changpingibacter yushuensis TaxID=2758440 RepID=UPI0015F3B7D9|nr:aminotransferase class I/II-fold pyridoxal phosphate-dependent enzyme [Changpingibacter yushuensis]
MQLASHFRITKSATLAINEEVSALRAAGEHVIHLGFGEAGLPPHPLLVNALQAGASLNHYPSTAGARSTRQAIASFFSRDRGLPTEPEQIVTAPGSKALIYALMQATDGAVVLTRPSWVSYGAQAALLGREVIWVDAPVNEGGFPEPDALASALEDATAAGLNPRLIVTTLPDNPSGCAPLPETVRRVAALVERYDLLHVSDEIYRELIHDPDLDVLSPADVSPDHVFVTGGLSKSLALGGWRTGFLRVPATEFGSIVRDAVVAIGSEIWSAMPAPVEPALELGVSGTPQIQERIVESRRLHGLVVNSVYDILVDLGVRCRKPVGGFYLYPDFGPHREVLGTKGILTSDDLAESLLRSYHVAALPGTAFGDHPENLCLRMATSMLYGATPEEKIAALDAADPLSSPVISTNLKQLREALTALLS